MNTNHKILLVGWGRCGKDCASAFLHEHCGLPATGSTSWAALPMMAKLLNLPQQAAWEQRHNCRQVWKDALDDFRKNDPLLLINLALANGGVVVTGIRDKKELDAAKEAGLFHRILWIDRPGIPRDPTVTFEARDCTDYVKNDGSLERFHHNLIQWAVAAGLVLDLSDYALQVLNDLDP